MKCFQTVFMSWFQFGVQDTAFTELKTDYKASCIKAVVSLLSLAVSIGGGFPILLYNQNFPKIDFLKCLSKRPFRETDKL